MLRLIALSACILLGGCATRGSLDISCDGFVDPLPGKAAFRRPLPLTALEKQIRDPDSTDTFGAGQTESGLLTRTLHAYQQARFRQSLHPDDPLKDNPELGEPSVLLLSGGGQWGAFGAGFLYRLAQKNAVPNFFVVTGVSTGSMQAMFVGSDHAERWNWLRKAYTIDRESNVVDRNSKLGAVVTGSFAGLGPLRERIETALCPSGTSCPAIDSLKSTDRQILIGYIEARSGNFFYSDVHQIATDTDAHNARQCIAGATLASSAMPVTFQQVRIDKRAYYDGGVRQSVFAALAEQLGRTVRAYDSGRSIDNVNNVPFYVIRNGPTSLFPEKPGKEADKSPNAFTAAERAQAIVTNQLEVGSIAALRLQKPQGDIRFISADGWEKHKFTTRSGHKTTCGAIRENMGSKMFDRDFMDCLMHYGSTRADEADPWRKLMTINPAGEGSMPQMDMILPPPANDN